MVKKIDLTLATPQQVKEIGGEINYLEKMLEVDKRSSSPKIQDEAEFVTEITKKKKLLANHTPKPFRGKNKDKAVKRMKELKSFIQSHMPRANAYYKRYPKNRSCDNDFEKTVKQQMAFQSNPNIQKAIAEFKNKAGRLEPDDPTIRSIENFRR